MNSELGFGVGFRTVHYRWVTENLPKVDWFEVISENFIDADGVPRFFLEKLRSNYPVVMHGVGLSIGSLDPVDKVYLRKLKSLCDLLAPPILSDHLSWSTYQTKNSHDLLPICYTESMLKHICRKVDEVQSFLGRRIALENPSAYLAFAQETMEEGEFLAELCKRTGCGILLDINNLFVNQQNLNRDPIRYINHLSIEMVMQFHLAGHTLEDDGLRIDTHDHPVPDEVWELYKIAVRKFPQVPTLVEWDDHIPEFSVLHAEALKAAKIASNMKVASPCEKAISGKFPMPLSANWGSDGSHSPSLAPSSPPPYPNIDFWEMMIQRDLVESDHPLLRCIDPNRPIKPLRGINVYNNAFFARIHDALKEIFEKTSALIEESIFHELVAFYLEYSFPNSFSLNHVGKKFPEFLTKAQFHGDLPHLFYCELAAFEWERDVMMDCEGSTETLPPDFFATLEEDDWETVSFTFSKQCLLGKAHYDLIEFWEGKEIGIPDDSKEIFYYFLLRYQDKILHFPLTPFLGNFLTALMKGESFQASLSEATERFTLQTEEEAIPQALEILAYLLQSQCLKTSLLLPKYKIATPPMVKSAPISSCSSSTSPSIT